MSRLPRTERLSVAARKNLRENWTDVKEDREKELSEALGQPWTIDIDGHSLYSYGQPDSWARRSPGDLIVGYVRGAKDRLTYLFTRLGDDFKQELNDACTARILTMDLDEDKLFPYCGCKISPDGRLVILFAAKELGTNIDYALDQDAIEKALNSAPTTRHKPMNYFARKSIAKYYEPEISAVSDRLRTILGKDLKLDPGFEDAFAKLKAADGASDAVWQNNMGSYLRKYFDAFANALEYQHFGSDGMLKEGLLGAAREGTVRFRILEELRKPYNETVIEDGVIYLQTTTEYFGVNIDNVSTDLVDIL